MDLVADAAENRLTAASWEGWGRGERGEGGRSSSYRTATGPQDQHGGRRQRRCDGCVWGQVETRAIRGAGVTSEPVQMFAHSPCGTRDTHITRHPPLKNTNIKNRVKSGTTLFPCTKGLQSLLVSFLFVWETTQGHRVSCDLTVEGEVSLPLPKFWNEVGCNSRRTPATDQRPRSAGGVCGAAVSSRPAVSGSGRRRPRPAFAVPRRWLS